MKKKLLFYFFLFSFFLIRSQETLVISEFLASNSEILMDEDGEYSDWIEIYNSASTEINLIGWYLTDDISIPTKWIFPDIIISANEYLIVFASGKNRKAEKNKLHTNFKLSASGEYLALTKPGGTIATEFNPAFPEQFQDISYGWASTEFIYFSNPSPGSANTGNYYISAPIFSVKHGFFSNSFNLSLSSNLSGVDIYYTTDASTPEKLKSIKYSTPVNIATTTVVRAIAVKEGFGESVTVTQTYIFPDSVIRQSSTQPGYPATWPLPISDSLYTQIPSNYNMKQNIVNRVDVSSVIVQSLKSLPVVSVVSDKENFFSKSMHPDSGGIYMYSGEPNGSTSSLNYHIGRGWTRPASIEYFNSGIDDGNIDFQENCAIKIHGGASRTTYKTEKRSFRIGFKSEYGPSKLKEQVFGAGSPKQYDWLVLRGGFAPRLGQQIRDPWSKSTMRDMGQYSARSKFVHLFLNGMYWGMYNLSERMDENAMRDNLGGSADDYDIIKDYYEVEFGDTVAWDKLVNLSADGAGNPDNYQRLIGNRPDGTPDTTIEKLVNPDNLIDYILFNMYAGTTDWDNHNWYAVRRKTNSEGFHFLVWDAESVFSNANRAEWIIYGGYFNRPSGVFYNLMKYNQFSDKFISHVNKQFFEGGAATPLPGLNRYEKWLAEIDTALIIDQARWVASTSDIWNKTYHSFRTTYFPARTETVFKQLVTAGVYPKVAAPLFNTSLSTIPSEFQLLMSSPDGGEIRYTLDGTDPGHFTLEGSKSILVYDNNPIPLKNDTINISARVKKDTLWSQLITKRFFVKFNSSSSEYLSKDDYLYSYPNPVKDYTNIVFSVSSRAKVNIRIFDVLGMQVASVINEYMPEGEHTINWNTSDLKPGIYFCVFESENLYKRITLVKE